MSQINNIITTTFRAHGGNVVSQLNSYASGFGRLGQSIDANTQMSSRLNNQWRAIGTTIRYAVAGTAIFGLQQMVRELSQVNTQLGQMQALTDIGTGTRFNDTQMGQLLNGLMETSVDTITPLSDVNDAAINFLSTVQGVKANQLPQMLSDIGIAARLSQADMESVTQAATTMQIAFGRPVNPGSVGQFSRMFQQLIGTAPGGRVAGTTISQAMPGLATMFQMAPGKAMPPNIAQAQMMALTQGVLMTGMPAATGMRGLTYLLQSIAQPSAGAGKALAGVGITPEFVQQQGIFAAVMKLLHQISPVSGRNAARLGALDIPDIGSQDPGAANALPGIPATEMQRLRTMIPRIHGIRAAIILASQLQQRGDVQSIAQDLTDYVKVQNINSQQAKDVKKAADDFRRNARMQEAATALHAAGIQMARAFNPITMLGSDRILGVTSAMRHHQRLTTDITRGGVGFLAAMGVARFAGIRLPGILGSIAGAPGQRFVQARAIEASMTGGAGLGASPQNPLYVTVVGQLFGGATPGPGDGGGSNFFKKIAAGRVGQAMLSRAGLTAIGSSATIAAIALAQQGDQGPVMHVTPHGEIRWSPTGRPYRRITHGVPGNLEHTNRQLPMNQVHQLILSQARSLFGGNVRGVSNYDVGMWKGQADVNMTITREGADGRLHRQRVHIPVDMWAHGRHPSHRGRKNIRGR
jgi:hypothetical protein